MKVLFKVDQVAALKRGIDTTGEWVELDVPTGELSQAERDLIAQTLDTSRVGKGASCPKATFLLRTPDNPGGATYALRLVEPSLQGLREAIGDYYRLCAQQIADREASNLVKAQSAIAELGSPETRESLVYLDDDGELHVGTHHAYPSVFVKLPLGVPSVHSWQGAEHLRPTYDRLVDARKESYKVALESARIELEGIARRRAETQAEQKRQWDALYARLPEQTRLRDAAGFTSDGEIRRLLKGLVVHDLQGALEPAKVCAELSQEHTVRLSTLTDEGYELAMAATAKLESLIDDVTYTPIAAYNLSDEGLPHDVEYAVQAWWQHPAGLSITAYWMLSEGLGTVISEQELAGY